METLNKITGTIKNSPIGFALGAGLSYYAMKKYVPEAKTWHLGVVMFIGGLIGTATQTKINHELSMRKMKGEIQGGK
jgi:uncharacterized membrane protein YfcA